MEGTLLLNHTGFPSQSMKRSRIMEEGSHIGEPPRPLLIPLPARHPPTYPLSVLLLLHPHCTPPALASHRPRNSTDQPLCLPTLSSTQQSRPHFVRDCSSFGLASRVTNNRVLLPPSFLGSSTFSFECSGSPAPFSDDSASPYFHSAHLPCGKSERFEL